MIFNKDIQGICNQMSSLKQLSAHQLNKMLIDTRDELKRRENIDKALKDIHAVLKKNIISPLMILTFAKAIKNQPAKKPPLKRAQRKAGTEKAGAGTKKHTAKTLRKRDQRADVAAKYHNPTTGDKWSGRGACRFGQEQPCTAEAINIEQFKLILAFVFDAATRKMNIIRRAVSL